MNWRKSGTEQWWLDSKQLKDRYQEKNSWDWLIRKSGQCRKVQSWPLREQPGQLAPTAPQEGTNSASEAEQRLSEWGRVHHWWSLPEKLSSGHSNQIFPTQGSPESLQRETILSPYGIEWKRKTALFIVYGLNIKENIRQNSQNHHFGNDIMIIISLGNIQLASKYSPGKQN